jgi:hypothetical protein
MTLQSSDYRQKSVPKLHWSRKSQPIAPAEVLMNRLQQGWSVSNTVTCKQHQYGPGRSVDIYTFTLTHNNDTMQLPVQSNPVVRRLLREHNLEIITE